MSVRVEVSGVDKVMQSFKAQSLKGKKECVGTVGYEAEHAIYEHEDMETYHENGQAKYLEQPARQLRKEMSAIVTRSIVNKNGLEEGVERAVKMLYEASQELVPVDTGELRMSGYYEVV